MFLTTFDKKMYEEAVRMDARAEGLEEGLKEGRKEGRQEEARENAKKLFENGVSYEVIRDSISILTDEELQQIYREFHKK